MIKTYLKIAWRSIIKNRRTSIINIGGLTVGLATAILIGLWIYDEISFDRNFENYENIAQVRLNQTYDGEIRTGENQALQLGDVLRNDFGENFKHVVMSSGIRTPVFSFESKPIITSGAYMEASAPELLSLEMSNGSREGLQNINGILFSESAALNLFGDQNPLGKTVKVDNKLELEVTGVYKDLPPNSFNELDFIASWDMMVKGENLKERVGWGNNWFFTYVQLNEQVDINHVSLAIKDIKRNHIDLETADRIQPELFLNPMNNWHLYSKFENGVSVGGRIDFVYLFGVIGAFVLFLACINFMNLSTASSAKRAQEVGLRKVVGSSRAQLIAQFMSESILVSLFAFLGSLLVVQLALPWFNEVSDKQISIPWTSVTFLLAGIGFTIFTGIVAGSYPAFYLSSFRPIRVLKGAFIAGRFAAIPRKALVVVQFVVSVILIIGTLIVQQQINFAKDRPVGYEKEGLMTVEIRTEDLKDHFEALRQELKATGAVEEISLSQQQITDVWNNNSGFDWEGKDPAMQDVVYTSAVNHEFGKTVGWEIIEGRDFSRDYASDTAGFILNRAAVEYMGFGDDPIGKTIKAFDRTYAVIGVVENTVSKSLYESNQQTAFYIDSFDRSGIINVKLNSAVGISTALAEVEAVFKKYDPGSPFEFSFASEDFAKKYAFEERIGKLTGAFTIIALLISCLGLFALASFVAEQRTKELGIRKVLGASTVHLWEMLTKEFVLLVLISCAIAIPISYRYLSGWLEQFQYRTPLYWWVFVGAGAGAMGITLLTVSFQSIKAALMNPVKSLKSE
ncbi:ABC transporter permease [Algoriphagus chordae]|uniref:ABC-type antimicrobial peptide transport system permease subunit n=1 Tax=Algoriphagus chordae TaxID=237019 RepID=A0A2W7QZ51_9BACT|nr:ABC transporter permease [Algoriphagus chordae]PZX51330.1 ABC-type antimicrobial peptide transport system permease subunit [Algoriphagus chordae]